MYSTGRAQRWSARWSGVLLILAVAATTGAAPAHAAGLKLAAIPGPDGTIPFLSPGGQGPTSVASPPGDKHRLFITTKDGYVYADVDGTVKPTPVLDLSAKTDTYNEDGMFSIVFDPNYATNRLFYITYSDRTGGVGSNLDDEHLDAFRMSASNPELADTSSEVQILRVPHVDCPSMSSPHYAGQLQFGPDGHLWTSVGDGSDGCGGERAALDLDSWHGKILRIDPRPDAAPDANGNRYVVPSDNPLVGQSNVRPEIWAYGLRNPYRFSFDPTTHAIVMGEVGLSSEEEVDRAPSTLAAGAPPPFFGWPCLEGNNPLEQPCTVSQTPVAPLFVKNHGADSNGDSYCTAIIGGYVLDDPSLKGDFTGRYIYGFFCADQDPSQDGRLYTTDLDDASPQPRDEGLIVSGTDPNSGFGLSSFGEDACDHPYAMNVVGGGLYRIEGPTPGPCGEYTAPQTTISSAPSGYVASTSATISFASSIAGSSFKCSLDGATATTCTSPATYSGVADGAHTFSVTASDEAGNTDASPATASWTVESGPPQTTISSAPSGVVASHSASVSFSSSQAGSTFKCSLDGATATTCTSPAAYSSLADGAHSVSVTATNGVGTPDASPATASWTVDTTAPQTTIASAPTGTVATRSASMTFSSSQTGSTFTCSLDGATATACTSPAAYSSLADGDHTFSVTATDPAGNADPSPATAAWTVEATPPDTSISSKPAALVATHTARFVFAATEPESTFKCSLDGAAATTCSSPLTYPSVADGDHTFSVTATNGAGTPDASPATAAWSVDTTAPQTTIAAAPTGTIATRSASITFSSSQTGSTFKCSLDGATATTCTSPAAYSSLADGDHTFSVTATDPAGNADPSPATAAWTVEATPPDTSISSKPAALVTTHTAQFAFTATEPDSTFKCSLDGAAATTCSSPLTYTSVADGDHTFSVTATNGAGTPDASPATAAWTVDTTAPETTISSQPTATTADTSATLAFTSSQTGSTFACSLDGATPASCGSPMSYTGLALGDHHFTVAATDPAGNADASAASATWTVVPPALAPVDPVNPGPDPGPAPPTTPPDTPPDTPPVTPIEPAVTPHLAFAEQTRLTIGASWRVPVQVGAISQPGLATLTLTRTGHAVAKTMTFQVLAGNPIAAHPSLNHWARELLRSRRALGVRVLISLKLASGKWLQLSQVFTLRR